MQLHVCLQRSSCHASPQYTRQNHTQPPLAKPTQCPSSQCSVPRLVPQWPRWPRCERPGSGLGAAHGSRGAPSADAAPAAAQPSLRFASALPVLSVAGGASLGNRGHPDCRGVVASWRPVSFQRPCRLCSRSSRERSSRVFPKRSVCPEAEGRQAGPAGPAGPRPGRLRRL